MGPRESDEVPLLSLEEAIAEVRYWLEVEKVDPEAVFTATGSQAIRCKDLILHLKQETPDGQLLRFAISRGRLMARDRAQRLQSPLRIPPKQE